MLLSCKELTYLIVFQSTPLCYVPPADVSTKASVSVVRLQVEIHNSY